MFSLQNLIVTFGPTSVVPPAHKQAFPSPHTVRAGQVMNSANRSGGPQNHRPQFRNFRISSCSSACSQAKSQFTDFCTYLGSRFEVDLCPQGDVDIDSCALLSTVATTDFTFVTDLDT